MDVPQVTDVQLIDYAAGSLRGPEVAAVEAAINRDVRMARTVAMYRLASQIRASDDTCEPSARAVDRARAIFTRAAQPHNWLDAVERIVARLVFDSRITPLAVRYADQTDHRQWAFETDDLEIDLVAERLANPSDGQERWRIMGQLSGAATGDSRRIALMSLTASTVVANIESSGEGGFAIELEPGRYKLMVESQAGVVEVSELNIS